jgi:hypothetical protein
MPNSSKFEAYNQICSILKADIAFKSERIQPAKDFWIGSTTGVIIGLIQSKRLVTSIREQVAVSFRCISTSYEGLFP